MRGRVLIWLLLSGTLGVMAWRWIASGTGAPQSATAGLHSGLFSRDVGDKIKSPSVAAPSESVSVKRPGYRLTNTIRPLAELVGDPRAVLLENALLDTRLPVDLAFPSNLRADGDPRCYIIQARQGLNDSFRNALARHQAALISYIPNNAYLVRIGEDTANQLAREAAVGAVLPFEPYYKVKASLLQQLLALGASTVPGENGSVPGNSSGVVIKALLFDDTAEGTIAQLSAAGMPLSGTDRSPFGTVVQISCPIKQVAWVARLSGVQELEPARSRLAAVDLTRATVGVAANSVAPDNYLGLTGSNILVNVNDFGVDTNQPDLAGRVFWDIPSSGLDNDGHGTHVAGIIAGSGGQSLTVTNAPGSSMPPVAMQFRGMAPAVRVLSISAGDETNPPASDVYLQQTAVSAGAFISNNSWHYAQDEDYDLGAASFDAAVRDALPGVPGSQPLLVVFAAGNMGNGGDNGTGGVADTIQSPGTAKNVITVGALEQRRFITNQTWTCSSNGNNLNCQTNMPWLGLTDSSNQVARFSSRGNVGPGVEGPSGRFKPDVVAPGTFVISSRSTTWDQSAYFSNPNRSLNLAPDSNSAQALSNLDNGLGPFYRFESGTSLSAAVVSGTLALMQEFFEVHLSQTNSPALMKALLINGAESIGNGYDLHSPGATNSQGWGVVRLPASLPASLTNQNASSRSMWVFDQSIGDALSTGQRRTRLVSVSSQARNVPLRVTLAWTDPPGNPLAGLKLVNDLDLIVTNLETGEVFLGNDIAAGATYNSARQPGGALNSDLVNNVENVYLAPGLGSNYSVTVVARRVGVNAVAEHPNGVVQDYALVISSGAGKSTDGLTVSDGGLFSSQAPIVTALTNSFALGGSDFGSVLPAQRAGSNDPLLATNSFPDADLTNAVVMVGTLNQWHFYVFTNTTPFTNAVFLTFASRPLAPFPAGGPAGSGSDYPWFATADVDLYVSQDSGLTNLDPAALAAADASTGRTGSEAIIYSNAVPGVYYIGVKCETSRGAEYGLVADVSQLPFAQADSQGNELLRGFPLAGVVPNGTPDVPGQGYAFFVTPDSFQVRRVIVTNQLSYGSVSDLNIALTHNSFSAVLHNNSSNAPTTIGSGFVYDDSQEGDISGAQASDGPGSLRQFFGQNAAGQWLLSIQSTNGLATNQAAWLFLERQQDLTGGQTATVLPGVCREDFLLVPTLVTNATTTATLVSGKGPITFQVYPAWAPPSNCPTLLIAGTSSFGSLTLDQFSQPPLNPGLYVVRTCNLGQDAANVSFVSSLISGPAVPAPDVYSTTEPVPIQDNAVTVSALSVTNTDAILSLEVGVRIDHPRISDLVLSLVGPDGTRVLLDDGRGGVSTNGIGANIIVTNTTPVSYSGGPQAVTNVFETGETSGTILINYDFFSLPDDMRVYYDGKLLYDSGMISFSGSTNINYGPGTATFFTVVMNQDGNSETNTSWLYSLTSTKIEPQYFTFAEDTNLTVTPVKFAPEPFTNLTIAPSPQSSANGIFYLPEESLDRFKGKSPNGQWRLELLDNRTGATNGPPVLVSWQLALSLADSEPSPIPLNASAPSTNLLAPGRIQWYGVDVPDWVSFVTNTLLSASAPVNLLFNPSVPPTGTNVGDILLGHGSSAGTWVLRTNAAPRFVPGSRYFLGVQNTNAATVSVAFQVAFDVSNVITLTAGVPYANTNMGPLNNADYYLYVVSTNAVRVQFEVNAPSGDVTLVARKGLPLPALNSYDFSSANPGTNDELIVVYDYSRPVALGPGEWFLAVINVTGSPAAYSILASEFPVYGTNIVVSDPVPSTNGICLSWNSVPGIHYYVQGKTSLQDAKWTNVSSTLTAADVTMTFCVPVPSPYDYFRVLEGLALVPSLPAISSIGSLTNGLFLQWSAPTNLAFQVQWSDSLAPAHWQSVPGSVTSSNGTFFFLDDGSRTAVLGAARFYRLEQKP